METLRIVNARVLLPGEAIRTGSVVIADGKIAACSADASPGGEGACVDAGGRLLTPGLIDVHTHGIGLHQFDAGVEAVRAAARLLPTFGVTAFLPTLVPRFDAAFLPLLAETAAALPTLQGACAPGLHLEGPFTALSGAGCATLPGDLGLLEEMLAACAGRLAVMSLSPETPNILPVIARLAAAGVVPFITHTRASVEETLAAIDAGAVHATHFYDVFPLPVETEPGARPAGAVEALLAHPRASVDFIADGVHVHPIVINMALAAKGIDGVLLITDANIGAGLPAGEYPTPWGYPVVVAPGKGARIAGDHPLAGSLAGSALTMNAGMRNLLAWLDLPPAHTWALGTRSPARLLGLPKGTLVPGADADLVLWEDDLTPAAVWVGGQAVDCGQG